MGLAIAGTVAIIYTCRSTLAASDSVAAIPAAQIATLQIAIHGSAERPANVPPIFFAKLRGYEFAG
jgi:hypothetical protein